MLRPTPRLAIPVLLLVSAASTSLARGIWVKAFQKISDTEGGFSGALDDSDWFGASCASLGDLDGDGLTDVAVGAAGDDDGGIDCGAVWILFLNADGSVRATQKISNNQGNFTGGLMSHDHFGISLALMGDLDTDGVVDLAVGAWGDDDGVPFADYGAVWILFLRRDGTVKAYQKISRSQGGFGGHLDDDHFGRSIAHLQDMDSDGVCELAVGAPLDDDGATYPGWDRGAVWILFLHSDGTVKGYQKISDAEGGFLGGLDDVDVFGVSVASPGDIDGDGVIDLAVGAAGDDWIIDENGAVWILLLNADGTVKSSLKIDDNQGGLGALPDVEQFGSSLASVGDLDGNGVGDLAVGGPGDHDENYRGAVWLLFLNAGGSVESYRKISDHEGGFQGILDDGDLFGVSVASLGDIDGDGIGDLGIGAVEDDDGGSNRGAVWNLFLMDEKVRMPVQPPTPTSVLVPLAADAGPGSVILSLEPPADLDLFSAVPIGLLGTEVITTSQGSHLDPARAFGILVGARGSSRVERVFRGAPGAWPRPLYAQGFFLGPRGALVPARTITCTVR